MRSLLLLSATLTLGMTGLAGTPAFAADGAHDHMQMDHVTEEINTHMAPAHHDDAHGHDTAHAEEGHHDEVQGLPQLDGSTYPSQIFWLLVTFALMYLPFRFKVLPDLSGVIERRREQIEGDLISAKNLKIEAENVHAAYETIVREARDKSSYLFTRAEEKIKEQEKASYAEFYAHAAKDIADAEEEIADATQKALATVNDVAAEVAAAAAEKLVGIKTDKKKAISVIETIGKKKAA